jgi:hypothetical protein
LKNSDLSIEKIKKLSYNSVYEWNDMLQVKGSNEQIYIRAFDRRELVVNSDCGIAIEKLYDLIKADLVVKE